MAQRPNISVLWTAMSMVGTALGRYHPDNPFSTAGADLDQAIYEDLPPEATERHLEIFIEKWVEKNCE